jgi:hypothetical protein
MVYLAKKGSGVVVHANREAMKLMDGIDTPDMTLTDAEWTAADGLARLIDGAIFLGKTDAEKRAEQEAAVLHQRDAVFAATVDRLCNAARWADLSGEEQAAWIQYRRDLRDITEQAGYPYDVVWPPIPE